MAFKMKNPSMAKMVKAAGDNRAAMKMKMEQKAAAKMKAESAMKMKKSPMEKELVGNQHRLPEELKAKIEAAPSKMRSRKGAMETEAPLKMKKSPMKADNDGSGKKKPQKATSDQMIKRSKSQQFEKDYYVNVGGRRTSVKRNPDTGVYTYKGDYVDARKVKEGMKRKSPRQLAAEAKERKAKAERDAGKKSPMKKDGTRFVDKVKAAGRALKDNLFKVHDHGNVHNTLTANTNRSYKKYKKQYREAAKKEAPAKMKKAAMKMSHKK